MEIQVHVHIHDYRDGSHHSDIALALGSLIELVHELFDKVKAMALTFDEVLAKVTSLDTAEAGVEALLVDIKAKLDAAIASGSNPAKLQEISDGIDKITQRAGAAVAANTTA